MMNYLRKSSAIAQKTVRTLGVICLFVLGIAPVAHAQYMEQFNTANKGYLPNFVDDFTGVNWTLTSPWVQNTDPVNNPVAGRDAVDYFRTTAGVLSGVDFDQLLCWNSPSITVPMSNVAFSVNIGWTELDRESISNTASDYIDVEYSINNGMSWVRLPTQFGQGLSGHTVCYRNDNGGGQNSGPTNNNNPGNPSLSSFSAMGITTTGTLLIRVCAVFNSPTETITIDNVSVPLGNVGGCTAPTLSTVVSNVSCNGGNTGAIDLSVSGGATPPYTYAWTGGATTQDISNLAVGTYTVIVTDNLMCSATTSATIGVAPVITATASAGDATCAATADGGVDITVSGGVPPYSYEWSNGAMTQDIDNVAADTYTVTITDGPGCTKTVTAVVGVTPAGSYSETFGIDGKGYLPNFVDNFVGVNWTIDPWPTTDVPNNITGREADDYFRTSGGALTGIDLDQNICWVSPVLDINPPGTGISFTVDFSWAGLDREDISNNASDFIDVEYRIDGGSWTRVPTQSPTATGLSGHTICYRNNNGGGQNSGPTDNNGSLVLTIPALSGNTLQIRVCSQFNGDVESISINSVSSNSGGIYCPAPEANAGPDQSQCGFSPVTLAATAANGTGVWSIVSGPSTSLAQFSNTSAGNATFTPAGGAGTYKLRWTVSANGFPDAVDEVDIEVKATPVATITPSPNPVCQFSQLNLSVADAGVGATYNWSGNGIINVNANTTTATPTSSGAQQYAVTVTGANACSATSTVSVSVTASPSAVITPTPSPVCQNSTLNLSVPSAGAGASYNWSGNGIVNANTNATTAVPTVTGTQAYAVTITLAGGCSNTGTVNVTVNALPSATITAPTSICQNTPFTISVPTAGSGASYSWSGNGVVNNNANSTTATPNTTGPQLYSVTVTNGAGCSSTATVTVTVNPAVPAAVITGGGTFCSGSSVSLSATAGGDIYTWQKSFTGFPNEFTTIGTGNPISVTESGVYRVIISNNFGCSSSTTTNVFIGDYVYNGSIAAGDQQQTGRINRFAVTSTCAAPKGCPGAFTTAGARFYDAYTLINPRNVPVCVTIGLIAPCGTNIFTAAYSGGFNPASLCTNYLADPGSSANANIPIFYQATVPANGTFVVVVHEVNSNAGCGSYTLTVDIPRDPVVITAMPNPACLGGTINLSVPSAGNGATYNWSGNGVVNTNVNTTSAIPSATGAQTYSVTVTSGSCNYTATATVNVSTPPSATITPSPNPVCQNTTLNLSVPSAGAGASYNWSGSGIVNANSNTTTASPSATGSQAYSVTVTTALGCSSIGTTNVTVKPKPSATITPTPNPVCQNATLTLSVPSAGVGATYQWAGNGINATNTNSTTAVPTVAGSQPYAVTVTLDGCINNSSVNVTVNPEPSATITASQAGGCGPALINLSVLSAGAGASYNWSGNGVVNNNSNVTTASPNSSGAQTYFVTVTNAQGCSKIGSATVNVNVCITGKIIWKQDNVSGVKDVTVTLTGDQTATVVTPLNGTYSFTTSSGTNFTITPTKNLNKMNGVNASDVFRIQQHLNGNLITDPYLLVAADVNSNNAITALDANIIQLSILGNPGAMAQFINSWRFVPTSYTMTNPPWGFPESKTYNGIGGGLSNQDFYGIKIGDVAAIYANPANVGAEPDFVVTTADKTLVAGNEFEVDFQANQIESLAALQLALHFDPSRLQLVDIQSLSGLPMTSDNFGLYALDQGNINVLWAGTETVDLSEAAPMFRLKFKVLQSGGRLSNILSIDETDLDARAYKGNLAESQVVLRFLGVTGTNDPTLLSKDRLVLYQNQPNPFVNETTIGYSLPDATPVTLTVFDVNGKLIFRQEMKGIQGYNQFILQDKILPVSGLMYYRVETSDASATRKMIRIE